MIGGRLPDVPEPSKIAQAGTEALKAVAQGGVSIGVDIAAGVEQLLFNSVEGGARVISTGLSGLVSIIKQDVNSGKTTVEKVRADIDRACNSVLSQVDRGVGQEIIGKFKREIEKQLR